MLGAAGPLVVMAILMAILAASMSTADANMHALSAQVVISQAAALRTGKRVMEMDFFAMIGMGAMWLNRAWEPMGEIGGGVKFYTGIPWLAFRIDVDNYVHNTVQPGKNSIDFDVMMSGGVSFLFPTRPSPIEKQGRR